jgi:hypothetical protein
MIQNRTNKDKTDYPADLSGKIALISRGSCDFGLKSAYAGAAGAVGAIIYNAATGPPVQGTLGVPPRPEGAYVPTLNVVRELGLSYVSAINSGATVTATIDVFTGECSCLPCKFSVLTWASYRYSKHLHCQRVGHYKVWRPGQQTRFRRSL